MTNHLSGIICYIGMGSNLEKPVARCREATEYLSAIKGCRVLRHSSYYRTEPVGLLNQDWFINAVIEMRATLPAALLFEELQKIEKHMGRSKVAKWGPRIIDLDLLLYGQEVIQSADLTVPHPELHKRRFVLAPLCEIAPYVIHPAFGVSISGLMKRLQDKSHVELLDEMQTHEA